MVLQFLAPLLGVGAQLFGARQAFRPPPPTPAEIEQARAIATQRKLSEALLDPESVISRNITAGERQLQQQAFARGLSDLIRASRRQQLLGRRSFFDPERRDEAISQYAARFAQQAPILARRGAEERLQQAIGAQRGIGQQFGSLIPVQQQRQFQQRTAPVVGLSALSNILSPGNISNILGTGARPSFGAPSFLPRTGGLSNFMGSLGSLGGFL